ncbi:MAG: KpsF/GutQ family sugar-phosphate isomerase [Armatimonadetes bacterium]|nr:KpsF/GutQ family sugar-phosphate isomerase [Akkermansiaceae bacterium]
MDYEAKAREVIELEADCLRAMAGRVDFHFGEAVRMIQTALDQRGKVVIIGVGKSGNVGHKIAATLNSTGATAVVMNSQNAFHGDLGLLNDGDVILALSYSGETEELLGLIPFLRSFDVKVIAMCGKSSSSLAAASDVALDVSVSREACPLNLAPTSSSTAMLVMGDALAMVLLESRGFTETDFARYHPGGSLGRALLLKVGDVMRREEKMPIVAIQAKVIDAVSEMNRGRAGACLVLDENGMLAGIFTHGDFARGYEKNPAIGALPVADLMTRNPISLTEDSLAVEAVKRIGEKRIDDIVVVNAEGKPVGLIDAQDLARLKLV